MKLFKIILEMYSEDDIKDDPELLATVNDKMLSGNIIIDKITVEDIKISDCKEWINNYFTNKDTNFNQ